MRAIVAATQNPGKLKELKYIMRNWPVQVLSIAEAGLREEEVEETGTTFEENALIKARALREQTELAVLSDDSGLCVHALDDGPGIYSARFGGDVPFSEKRRLLLELMQDVTERSARFVCAIALIDEQGREHVALGSVEGVIAQEERGEWGFGYDALFELPDGRTFGEIPFEEKHDLSHRYHALQAMKERLDHEDDPDLL